MTKLANSFLFLHDFFAIMHVNLEAKVLPNAASKGGMTRSSLYILMSFLLSSPPSTDTALSAICIFSALEITSILSFFFNRTEILNFESNTEPSKSIEQYRYFGESLHPYMKCEQAWMPVGVWCHWSIEQYRYFGESLHPYMKCEQAWMPVGVWCHWSVTNL